MCGFFAFIKRSSKEITSSELKKIDALLEHRGPDSSGSFQNQDICLVHRRLAIIDLNKESDQPFFSKSREWVIVYNGEIYNYISIRERLQNEGVSFQTNSDTEALVEAINKWGIDQTLKALNGMFSFVAFNLVSKKTFIVRDRLGVKPLYISKTLEGLYISSEIKPLLLFNKFEVSPQALNCYIQMRYSAGPETLFKSVKQVEPGTYISTTADDDIKVKTWWSLDDLKPQESSADIDIWKILSDAISIRNIADVKVGSFLSGGIDSATITAQLKRTNPDITSITMGIPTKIDESQRAFQISKYLNINHQLVSIQPEDFDLYKKSIEHLENPIGDSILVPTYLLAKECRKLMKVVLSGEGADEVFSGYIHHQVLSFEESFSKYIPKSLLSLASRLISNAPQFLLEAAFPYPARLGISGKHKIANHFLNLKKPYNRYSSLVSLFDDIEGMRIWNLDFSNKLPHQTYWESLEGQDANLRLRKLDLKYWTPDYTLQRLDKLTMAHGLEARVPFYDYRLVEACLRMPTKKVMTYSNPKKLLRDSIPTDLLPREVVKRKKQAFYLPTEDVFKEPFRKWAKEIILDNASKRPWWNTKYLNNWFEREHFELLDNKRLQLMLNLELWAEIYCD